MLLHDFVDEDWAKSITEDDLELQPSLFSDIIETK